jgi:hypothetical protein
LDTGALVEYLVDEWVLEDNNAGGGHWNYPRRGRSSAHPYGDRPLVELVPSVHTVGDGGHAVGARDAGSETVAYAVSNVESAGDRGVCSARIKAIHSENSSGGQPCSAADTMDWIETKAI